MNDTEKLLVEFLDRRIGWHPQGPYLKPVIQYAWPHTGLNRFHTPPPLTTAAAVVSALNAEAGLLALQLWRIPRAQRVAIIEQAVLYVMPPGFGVASRIAVNGLIEAVDLQQRGERRKAGLVLGGTAVGVLLLASLPRRSEG
jgi:hypothetical protein